MKLKIRLDSNTLKQFFLDHVEKVLFGLVVLCFLLFVYRAVARDTLPWQPDFLVQESQAAKQNVESTKAEPLPVPNYSKMAEGILTPIPEADYVFKTPWDPLKFAENRRREYPELYPLKDLRAAAGSGAFAMAPDDEQEEMEMMAMRATRGRRWVVLTALIDHLKQKQAYDAAFQDAVQWDPQRDYPDYVAFKVERAEVDPRVQTAELAWAPIPAREMLAQQDFWLQPGSEAVDPVYLPPPRGSWSLAFPLGPLQNRAWGSEVAHPPEIPFLESAMAGMMAGGMPGMASGDELMPGMAGPYGAAMGRRAPRRPATGAASGAEAEEEIEEDPKAIEAARKAAAEKRRKARQRANLLPDEPDVLDMAGGAMGAMTPGGTSDEMMPGYGTAMRSGRRMRMPGPGMMPGSAGMSMPGGMPGMSSPGMMPGMRGAYGRRGMTTGEEEELTEEEQEVQYMLFRFFDFSVAPGKHYRYRVKLVLLNPNLGLLPHFVEKEGMEKTKFLDTEWSEPSPIVSVPLDSQVLTVSAKASNGTASVMLVRFNEQDGALASEEFAVTRGQLLDYRDRTFTDPGGVSITMYEGGAPQGMTAEERRVDYVTQALLLDVAGGGPLPGRDRSLAEPGSILLLDASGNLAVRDELDDLADVRFYEPPEVPTPGMGPMAMPGMSTSDDITPGDPYGAYGAYAGKGAKTKTSKRGAGSAGSSAMSGYPGYPAPSKSGRGGSATSGSMPGMMPGSSSGGVGDLDDGIRRRPPRRSRGSSSGS